MNFKEIEDSVLEYAESYYAANKMSFDKQAVLTTELVQRFINEGYRKFVSKSRLLKKTATVLTTATIASYTLPAKMFDVVKVLYYSGTNFWKIDKIQYDEILYAKNLSGSPVAYLPSYGERLFTLYPAPTASNETVEFLGVFMPDDLVNETDIPIVPENYQYAIVDYAVYKIQDLIITLDVNKSGQYQKNMNLLTMFLQAAEECRQENEFSSDENFRLLSEDETYNLEKSFNRPTFTTSPVISVVQFANTLKFIDTTTNTVIFEFTGTGLKYMGVNLLNFVSVNNGTGTFNSTTGTTITLTTAQADALYNVGITPIGVPDGSIGDITVVRNSTTQFTVYNAGSNNTAQFLWSVSPKA